MGFGTLFIGYFLLLNIASYEFTDAIAAIVMLYGIYKLSSLNKGFKRSLTAVLIFSAFGIFELGYGVYDMFFSFGASSETVISVISLIRYAIVALVTIFVMLGMSEVANEVKLRVLAIKCERVLYMTIPIYAMSMLLEAFSILELMEYKIVTVISILTLICNIALTILALICIYSCYMKICMPSQDAKADKPKTSRFAFVNAFRKHEEEKQREYAEYKLEKMKERAQRKKGKK